MFVSPMSKSVHACVHMLKPRASASVNEVGFLLPVFVPRNIHNRTLMTQRHGVNKRDEEKYRMDKKKRRGDAGRNVIIGQCEPKEGKATRGFMNKQADTV